MEDQKQQQEQGGDNSFLGAAMSGDFTNYNGVTDKKAPEQESRESIEELSKNVEVVDGEAPVVDHGLDVDDEEGAGEAPDTKAEKPVKKELSALDKYLQNLQEEDVDEPVSWNDDAKKALKSTFGNDDPEALKQEYSTLKERVAQASEAIERAERMQKNIDSMPYELSQALNALAEGKPYQPFLEKLAKGVSLSNPAKDISEEALINTYYGKKFSAEQMEAISDGDESLKGVWDEYVTLAREKHDGLRANEQKSIQDRGAQAKQAQEASRQADAAAVAYLKNEKALSTFADKEAIDKFLSGDLERELLYNDDGTRKPESFALLLAARHHKSIVEAIRKGALTQGKNEATHRKHAALQDKPGQGSGKRPPVKQEKDDKSNNVTSMLADVMGLT